MPAYLIVTLEEMINPTAMQDYAANVDAIVRSFGGTYLVPRGEARAIEGSWDPGVLALIEFPSSERVMAYYESDAYRPWRDLRHRSARTSIVVASA